MKARLSARKLPVCARLRVSRPVGVEQHLVFETITGPNPSLSERILCSRAGQIESAYGSAKSQVDPLSPRYSHAQWERPFCHDIHRKASMHQWRYATGVEP